MMVRRVTTRGSGLAGLLPGRTVEEVATYRRRRLDRPTLHRFRWWCLILVTGGRGRVRWSEGDWAVLLPGSYVQVAPGESVAYGSDPATASAVDHVYISWSGAGTDGLLHQGLVPATRRVHPGGEPVAVLRFVERLHSLLAERRPRAQDRAWVVLQELLVDLLHQREAPPAPPPAAVEVLRVRLEARPEDEVDLAGFAAEHRISLPHLRAGFRRETGHAIGRFQAHCRCDRARQLLLETDLPVAAVGAAVGLPHPVSFARFFRRLTGWSPSRWRRDQLR